MCSSKNVAFKIDVEGSRLNVCEKCSSYGRIIARITAAASPKAEKKKATEEVLAAQKIAQKSTETVQIIKPDFAKIIREAREKTGLNQEEFSKKINERESLLNKIESGHIKPDLEMARKLEKALKVSIVDSVEIEPVVSSEKKKGPEGLTIGDLIRVK